MFIPVSIEQKQLMTFRVDETCNVARIPTKRMARGRETRVEEAKQKERETEREREGGIKTGNC